MGVPGQDNVRIVRQRIGSLPTVPEKPVPKVATSKVGPEQKLLQSVLKIVQNFTYESLLWTGKKILQDLPGQHSSIENHLNNNNPFKGGGLY